jgi:putative SOS response-associated peptidase YedK
MCGRYTLHNTPDEITERFAVSKLRFDVSPRYNIAPSQTVPAITQESDRCLDGYQWGLIPFWSKDPEIGARLINARAETLADKPAFKYAFARRRCLIPANGFYEWKQAGGARQPVHIRLRQGKLFAFAGLWEQWRPEAGPPVRSCTIITVEPNSLLAPIHSRMPAILHPDTETLWLDISVNQPQTLLKLLQPYPSNEMECFAVSRRVNSSAFDDPSCLHPI